MESHVGEFLGEVEDPPNTACTIEIDSHLLCLSIELRDGADAAVFQYVVTHGGEEHVDDDSRGSVDIAFHEKDMLWHRSVSGDDGYYPDAIREIAKTLDIELGNTFLTSPERGIGNIKILISMFREKSGLR